MDECKRAAKKLGFTFKFASNAYSNWPEGCFQWNGGNFYFNTGKNKKATEDHLPVCKECGIPPKLDVSYIMGGSEASPYSIPWQVALVNLGSNFPCCGGTIISPRHILTAAHCLKPLGKPRLTNRLTATQKFH